jgi:hypothetical protein
MDKPNAVAVGILHIHLAVTPSLVSWFEIDANVLLHQLFIQAINVVHDKVYDATRNPVARKGRHMQPHIVTCKTYVARIRLGLVNAVSELPNETEPFAIELLRYGGITYVKDGDRGLEHGTPPLCVWLTRRR